MKREDIKTIMVVHSDNDFITTFDWIGKVVLMTINMNINILGDKVLLNSDDIENFIKSLLSSSIEFIQCRTEQYEYHIGDFYRYENISEDEVIRLTKHFDGIRFKYNFDEKNDDDFLYGGSELLIIDIENNKSYIK